MTIEFGNITVGEWIWLALAAFQQVWILVFIATFRFWRALKDRRINGFIEGSAFAGILLTGFVALSQVYAIISAFLNALAPPAVRPQLLTSQVFGIVGGIVIELAALVVGLVLWFRVRKRILKALDG